MIDQNEAGVLLPIPLAADRVFRNQAMDDMLTFLYRNPHQEFGVRELRDITGHGAQTVDDAIDVFTRLALIETRRAGNRKLISINRERIQKPADPIMEIPQEEFRTPIKTFRDTVREEQDNLVGLLVFGSVARGAADRASDIDLLVIVDEYLPASRRAIQDVRQRLSDTRFDGNRYEFQVMAESIDSATQYGEKLETIFSDGITIHDSDQLQELRGGILHG